LQTTHIPPALHAELAKLSDAAIFELLSEIIEPSYKGPFEHMGDDLSEVIYDTMSVAYGIAYDSMAAIFDPAPGMSDDWGARADFLYEMERDRRMGL